MCGLLLKVLSRHELRQRAALYLPPKEPRKVRVLVV